MVGGEIIGIIRKNEYTENGVGPIVTVHVHDTRTPNDTCLIDVMETMVKAVEGHPKVRLCVGDSSWWQSRVAMWTPKGNPSSGDGCGQFYDIQIPRVGYSYSMPEPAREAR